MEHSDGRFDYYQRGVQVRTGILAIDRQLEATSNCRFDKVFDSIFHESFYTKARYPSNLSFWDTKTLLTR